jgi:hypothetical protein
MKEKKGKIQITKANAIQKEKDFRIYVTPIADTELGG